MKSALILFIFPILCFCQSQRFVYEYRFVPNLNKKDSLVKEIMFLDVRNSKSNFYSAEKFRSDSIAKASVEQQIKAGLKNFSVNKTYSGNNNFTIRKNLQTGEVMFEDKIADDIFLVKDNRKISWKIKPEKIKIGEWMCQSATATFAGRNWNVWFCPEIPLQEGPYKFFGLPGMIVKIEDAGQTHQFNLVAIQKLPSVSDSKVELKANEVGYGFDSKPIAVSAEKFDRLLKNFRLDPTASFRQMLQNKNMTFSRNGLPLSNQQVIREREEFYRKKFENLNNPIEKDLLK